MHTYVAYVCARVKGHRGLADYGYAAYDCATTPRTGVDACRGWEEQGDRPAECAPVVYGGVVVMIEKASNGRAVRLASCSRTVAGDAFDIAAVARSIEPIVPLSGGSPPLSRTSSAPPGFVAGNNRAGPEFTSVAVTRSCRVAAYRHAADDLGQTTPLGVRRRRSLGPRAQVPGPAFAALINS